VGRDAETGATHANVRNCMPTLNGPVQTDWTQGRGGGGRSANASVSQARAARPVSVQRPGPCQGFILAQFALAGPKAPFLPLARSLLYSSSLVPQLLLPQLLAASSPAVLWPADRSAASLSFVLCPLASSSSSTDPPRSTCNPPHPRAFQLVPSFCIVASWPDTRIRPDPTTPPKHTRPAPANVLGSPPQPPRPLLPLSRPPLRPPPPPPPGSQSPGGNARNGQLTRRN
jgi:hypothetical protein